MGCLPAAMVALTLAIGALAPACADTSAGAFEPVVGQAGKDVIWVPTPYALVEAMLDLAQVTPQDFVMDVGSGDGRNIIAAAKRGARGMGVEFNPEMVELSKRTAAREGVGERATFVQGDMYEADLSRASVLALFLLPENLRKLTPQFLELKPGSRIVANGFGIPGWDADQTETAKGDCGAWCTAILYIVPAKVAGTWRMPEGELTLEQNFQMLMGTLKRGGTSTPISEGKLRGNEIRFTAGGKTYVGLVNGETMVGNETAGSAGAWSAKRATQ